MTAIFFGVSNCDVNKPWRTGIGSPSPTNEPAMVGVVARVGMLTLPALPKFSDRPMAASRGYTAFG